MSKKSKRQPWAVGTRFRILEGEYAGEEGVITEFDILGLSGLGCRCSGRLSTGPDTGKVIFTYTGRLENLDCPSTTKRKGTGSDC